eukprot:scaffold187276_cov18-Tisochrysis_lutea.AAC.1
MESYQKLFCGICVRGGGTSTTHNGLQAQAFLTFSQQSVIFQPVGSSVQAYTLLSPFHSRPNIPPDKYTLPTTVCPRFDYTS